MRREVQPRKRKKRPLEGWDDNEAIGEERQWGAPPPMSAQLAALSDQVYMLEASVGSRLSLLHHKLDIVLNVLPVVMDGYQQHMSTFNNVAPYALPSAPTEGTPAGAYRDKPHSQRAPQPHPPEYHDGLNDLYMRGNVHSM
uniref:Uncharacterized protein n=1 Tax=Prymnesium polylepis TaxID=72548 RepID=A0A7S4JAU3_9EUKA